MKALSVQDADDMQVFVNLAEQIKLPFVQIAHAAELLESGSAHRDIIRQASESALYLIDGFLLHSALQKDSELAHGTVSISSLLFDVSETLRGYAAAKGCRIELDVRGKYGPAYAHREAIRLALINLGYSFIDAVSGHGRRAITLSLRRTSEGLSVGVFADAPHLTSELVERAQALQGGSHQPLAGFTSTNGAGIFVAEQLLSATGAPMRFSRQGKLRGLATTLLPSRQLSLV